MTEEQYSEVLQHLREEPVNNNTCFQCGKSGVLTEFCQDCLQGKEQNPLKEVIEYDIPINDKEKCEEINKSLGTKFRGTEEHIEELFTLFQDAIERVGDKGGWYIGDGIKVKIELEYDPENK
jgi:hypothetical protein